MKWEGTIRNRRHLFLGKGPFQGGSVRVVLRAVHWRPCQMSDNRNRKRGACAWVRW
jgi:hypothetical protein